MVSGVFRDRFRRVKSALPRQILPGAHPSGDRLQAPLSLPPQEPRSPATSPNVGGDLGSWGGKDSGA